MSDPPKPTFLVDASANPVAVQIHGKANYLNCNHFREFMQSMLREGRTEIQIDFSCCKGMDSTFIGILAGSALELNSLTPSGNLLICNLDDRNRGLISNLGLESLFRIDTKPKAEEENGQLTGLNNEEVCDAEKVLQAHQDLVRADAANCEKFEDVITFLKNQVDSESSA